MNFTHFVRWCCFCKQEQEIRKIGALFVEGTVEGMQLPVCSDLTDGVTIEIEPGTTGGSKMWVGKDYSNPINKDFFEVDKPYQGTTVTPLVLSRVFFVHLVI